MAGSWLIPAAAPRALLLADPAAAVGPADAVVMTADVLASAAAQAGVGAAVLTAWWAWRRRWIASAVCAAAAVAAAAGVLPGRSIAADTTRPADHPVRLLVWNVWPPNNDPEDARGTLLASDADLLVLMESPHWLIEEFKAGGVWRERWPHYWLPDGASTGFRMVLSRWPQRDLRTGEPGAHRTGAPGGRAILVDRPGGAFGLIMCQARSPRSIARWRDGNRVADAARWLAQLEAGGRGLEAVVAGDFNAAPAGVRTRRLLAAAGLRRAKPLLPPTGTFPAALPGPASAAIDDAMISRGVRVLRWQTLPPAGSDHRPVLIDLAIPPSGDPPA